MLLEKNSRQAIFMILRHIVPFLFQVPKAGGVGAVGGWQRPSIGPFRLQNSRV